MTYIFNQKEGNAEILMTADSEEEAFEKLGALVKDVKEWEEIEEKGIGDD